MNARLSKDERRVVAQRIFAALCAHYPDRYIAFVEQPGHAGPSTAAAASANEIADPGVARDLI
jgi:hypothetical protein